MLFRFMASSSYGVDGFLPLSKPDASGPEARFTLPEGMAEGRPGGVISAHSVNAGARRGGGRTEEHGGIGRFVGDDARGRPGDQLPKGLRAPRDVPAHVVLVVAFDVPRKPDGPGQDAVPKSGGEPLDLTLDPLPHVDRGAVRDVTVRPGRVAARGGASWIEQARLDQDQKRTVRMFSPPHVGLAGCQLLDRSAHVHGPGSAARL